MAGLTWGMYFKKMGDYFFGREIEEKKGVLRPTSQFAIKYFCGPPLDAFEAGKRAIYQREGSLADNRANMMDDALEKKWCGLWNGNCRREYENYKTSKTTENLNILLNAIESRTKLPPNRAHMTNYINERIDFEIKHPGKTFSERYICPNTFYFSYTQHGAKSMLTEAHNPPTTPTPGRTSNNLEVKRDFKTPNLDRAASVNAEKMKHLKMPTYWNMIHIKFLWPPFLMHAILRPFFHYPAKWICGAVNYCFGESNWGVLLKVIFAGPFMAGDFGLFFQAQLLSFNGLTHLGKSCCGTPYTPKQMRTPRILSPEPSAENRIHPIQLAPSPRAGNAPANTTDTISPPKLTRPRSTSKNHRVTFQGDRKDQIKRVHHMKTHSSTPNLFAKGLRIEVNAAPLPGVPEHTAAATI